MRIYFFIPLLFFSLYASFFTPRFAHSTPDPQEQLRPLIDEVTVLLGDADFKQLSKDQQFDQVFSLVRQRFDFQEMSKRVLGPQWRNLNAQQRQSFEHLFTQLLQYTYVDKIDAYAGEKVEYINKRIKGERAEVQTLLKDSKKSIPVSYIMHLRDNEWMVYDLVVEGVSLVRNYMEQFRTLLQKDGYEGLVRQLKAKITQMQQTHKG